MSKKLLLTLCVLCVAVFCISALTVSVFATDTTEATGTTVETERTVTASGTCGAEGDNLTWTLYDDGELVISGTGEMASVYPWSNFVKQITKFKINEGVTSFYWASLTNAKVEVLSIPSSIINIPYGSFGFYRYLQNIEVSADNMNYVDVDGVLFTKDMKTLVVYPSQKSGESYTVPNGVTKIADNAFSFAIVESVTFLPTLTEIGAQSFQYSSLSSVTVPATVTTLGDAPFMSCNKLAAIVVDENNPNYASSDGVLYSKDFKTLIQYPNGRKDVEYTVPDGVMFIKSGAFTYAHFNSVTVPVTTVKIGGAFQLCLNLEKFTVLSEKAELNGLFSNLADGFTMYGGEGSTAQAYANSHGYNFEVIELPEQPVLEISTGIFGADGDNLFWTLNNNGELVIRGIGEMEDWTWDTTAPWYEYRAQISSIIIENGITKIGDYAFYYLYKLESVVIPEGVKRIGANAFCGCSSLANVSLPEGMETLEFGVFQNCSSLTTITFPSTATSISDGVFLRCTKLTDIKVHKDNGTYVAVNGVLFAKDMKTLYTYPMAKSGDSYVVPEGVTEILSGAFEGCSQLKSITLPQTLLRIESAAFRNCSGIAKITIPASVTHVISLAFDKCSLLSEVTIYSRKAFLGAEAFRGCADGFTIYGGAGSTAQTYATNNNHNFVAIELPVSLIASGKFGADGDNLTWSFYDNGELVIEGVGDMPEWLSQRDVPWYSYRSNISKLTVKSGVSSIGRAAFYEAKSLVSIDLPASVKNIGEFAFSFCWKLDDLNLPEGVETIKDCAFQNCMLLTGVNIPASLTSLSPTAFNLCNNISAFNVAAGSIAFVDVDGVLFSKDMQTLVKYPKAKGDANYKIPENVKHLGGYAFTQCNFLNIDLPIGLLSIGESAFSNCIYLESVLIPETVTNIGADAFANCYGLSGIYVPKNVSSIGSGAFYGTGLDAIEVAEDNSVYTDVNGVVFTKDMKAIIIYPDGKAEESYTIPNGVTVISDFAFADCEQLKHVVIPTGVTSIGVNAFGGSGIESVTLPQGLKTIETQAFRYCDALTSIEIPASVTKIDYSTFSGCSSLSEITVYSKSVSLGSNLFSGCAEGFTTYGGAGSTAQTYATRNNHNFIAIELPVDKFGTCGPNLTWELKDDGELVIEGTGSMYNWANSNAPWYELKAEIKKLTICSGVSGVSVGAFRDCTALESVELPTTLRGIYNAAFANCTSLKSIVIPEGVTSIAGMSFLNCTALQTVQLPSTVRSILPGAFERCLSLTAFSVHTDNEYYEAVGGVLYSTRIGELVCYPSNRTATSFVIPDSVKFVISGAFDNVKNLVDLTVPYYVAGLDSNAFVNCESLASVTFKSKILSFQDDVFVNCSDDLTFRGADGSTAHAYAEKYGIKFTKIDLPKTAKMFGTFGAEKKNLVWIIYDDGELLIKGTGAMEDWGYYDDATGEIQYAPWYDYIYYITKVTFENEVTNIGSYAFYGCGRLETIVLPETVTTIGSQAFSYCAFESIELPSNLTFIGYTAFLGCGNLSDVTIPANVKQIEANAFSQCNKLDAIKVAEGNAAYTSVDGVLFSKDLKTLLSYPAGKTNVEYEIPVGTQTIASQAFIHCKSLESIAIPSTVTEIWSMAFAYCTALKEITVPYSVQLVDFGAFVQCSALKKIAVESRDAQINDMLFSSRYTGVILGFAGSTAETYANEKGYVFEALGTVMLDSGSCGADLNWSYYSDGVLEITGNGAMYDYASAVETPWYSLREEITKLTVGDGVTEIGDYAFYGCKNLKNITLPKGTAPIATFARLASATASTGIQRIGDYAFGECSSMESFTVPVSVTELGEGAFANCTALESITVLSEAVELPVSAIPEGVKITAPVGSPAEDYATANGQTFYPTDLKFAGASLSLQHNLTVNFAVAKSLIDNGSYENVYATFTMNGVETVVDTYTASGSYYMFKFKNIAPHKLGDTVEVQLHGTVNGKEYSSAVTEYSILNYCNNMLKNYNGAKRDELRTMLVDLLYYGAASQVYMEYKTDNLVTSALTEEQKAWGTSEAPTLTSVLSPNYATVENPEVRLVGASLNLKDAVRVKLVFSAENIEGLSFKAAIEGKEWIISSESFVDEGNGNYSMLFSGLHAGQMSESIYFTAMRNGEAVSNTARYSIESYAYQKQNDANTALADLVKTMMNYGNAAKAYANAQ